MDDLVWHIEGQDWSRGRMVQRSLGAHKEEESLWHLIRGLNDSGVSLAEIQQCLVEFLARRGLGRDVIQALAKKFGREAGADGARAATSGR